jgi:hypothetical protein
VIITAIKDFNATAENREQKGYKVNIDMRMTVGRMNNSRRGGLSPAPVPVCRRVANLRMGLI